MITSNSSPIIHTSTRSSPSYAFSPRPQYENAYRPRPTQPAIRKIVSGAGSSSSSSTILHPGTTASPRTSSTNILPISYPPGTIVDTRSHSQPRDRLEGHQVQMVDASTQYSPPKEPTCSQGVPASGVANLQLEGSSQPTTFAPIVSSSPESPKAPTIAPRILDQTAKQVVQTPASTLHSGGKRNTADGSSLVTSFSSQTSQTSSSAIATNSDDEQSAKRPRPPVPAVKLMPMQYEHCDPKDLAVLISSMLMELIRYNDTIPLRDGHLTRFHSRAAPTISISDYLQRLTTHATLSPPILLSMVFYIDRLCALYPAFTISSLTVHRFLITSATVASKGLSDSFWTNKTYARVGGVKLKELALLELEFLWRVEWRIVPRPEVLVDYYRSLVDRSEGYEIDTTGRLEGRGPESATTHSAGFEQSSTGQQPPT